MMIRKPPTTVDWASKLDRSQRAALVRAITSCVDVIVTNKMRLHSEKGPSKVSPTKLVVDEGIDERSFTRLKGLVDEGVAGKLTDSVIERFERFLRKHDFGDIESARQYMDAKKAYSFARRNEPSVELVTDLRARLNDELGKLNIRPRDLHQTEELDIAMRKLIFEPLGEGLNHAIHDGYRILYFPIRHCKTDYASSNAQWYRLLEAVMGAGATAHIRTGNEYHHTIASHMELLLKDNPTDTLRVRILAAEHTRNLTSDASIRAIQLMPPPKRAQRNLGLARVYTYAAETLIHCGKDFRDPIPNVRKLTVESAIRLAIDMEMAIQNYDGAMRYRTNLVRCHMFNGRLELADREIADMRFGTSANRTRLAVCGDAIVYR